jgi:hypothetical protein
MKKWIDRFKGVATKYLDNYLACFLFVDSSSNESTKQHIKEFLLTSFVFEMTETYDSLRRLEFITRLPKEIEQSQKMYLSEWEKLYL